MGKARSAARKRAQKIDWEKAGTGMVIDLKTRHVERWEIQFFDALDLAGCEIDREHYFANVNKKRKHR